MRLVNTMVIMLLAVGLLAAAGCSRKKQPYETRTANLSADASGGGGSQGTSSADGSSANLGADGQHDHGIPETRPETDSQAGVSHQDLPPVYFALDSYELGPEAKVELQKAASFLTKNPQYHAIIHGHTDSSGTSEYNMSLGSRRAQAVREFLVENGVPADRLETVSFGKERPLAPEDDAASRAANRRSEFLVFELE